jgi:hypothetical protein
MRLLMHKKGVLIVDRVLSNAMEKRHYVNSGSNACGAITHSFGKKNTIASPGASTGSDYGLQRVALSNYYADYLVTVE